MAFSLYAHQEDAAARLHSGSVLCGEVGTGKTLTGLAYYLRAYPSRQLFVITTAKKRDGGDWIEEASLLGITELIVDSWNNIANYTHVKDAFFIFDEQRAVGYGKWANSMIKIAGRNKWIMMTGTPGDNWMDYMSVMIANGFYRNKTDFVEQHVEYDRFAKFPRVKRYHNTDKLERFRRKILVKMDMERSTIRHRTYIECEFDQELYSKLMRNRFNIYTNKPMRSASELASVLRKIVANSDGRIHEAAWQLLHLRKVIVFYNYDYELDILRDLCEFLGKPCSEWNGHKHEEIVGGGEWAYLVQYAAGAEGWNCIETNQIMFYSPNYSYKATEQAEGRIDRLNTPFRDLYYTYLISKSSIDKAVIRANVEKRKFNEKAFAKRRV